MSETALLSFIAASCAGAIALLAAVRQRLSVATWLFIIGMAVFGAESLFAGLAADAILPEEVASCRNWKWSCAALLPALWLAFSVGYSRAEHARFLVRWRPVWLAALVLPVAAVLICGQKLVQPLGQSTEDGQWLSGLTAGGKVVNFLFLLSALLILMNLERTFRASVGTMRWRIKFMIIGLGVVFATRAYTSSQMLLYGAAIQPSLPLIDSGGLVLGCLLILRSLLRGPSEVAVYVPDAGLRPSWTLLIAGIYLFIVGVLANLLVWLGGAAGFSAKAFLILLSLVGATVLLLSDRFRLHARRFISRSLQRPLYDYRTVWRNFTQGTASRLTEDELCKAAVKLSAEVFQVLSLSIWLVDEKGENLTFAASTSLSTAMAEKFRPSTEEALEVIQALRDRAQPADIERSNEAWATVLRRCQPSEFESGGSRVCAPMIAGGELMGVMILGDRVGGASFSVQDFDLLKCVADQVAAGLLNSQLSQKLLQAKELEAFQTMSAFFVHDLKNTANTLNLMIQNLPVHFDNPAFREDALRAITKSGQHINQLIGRLSVLRHDLQIRPAESDLNSVVSRVLSNWNGAAGVKLVKQLGPVPKLLLDEEQFQKVVTNLVLNATEAISSTGEIRVETNQNLNWAIVTVADNGCGMDTEFMNRSLFRPFQTTKKNGFGIGMFQSRMIVEAHGGRIEVESQLNKGTTFRVFLPLKKA